jgi:hypothetical protein
MFTGILIFKGLTARRLYKSFGVKVLIQHEVIRTQVIYFFPDDKAVYLLF